MITLPETLLDIHTHHPAPDPNGIICCPPSDLPAQAGTQPYSIGIHPWELGAAGLTPEQSKMLRECAGREDVVAIGETGFDLQHPGAAPLFAQMLSFKAHVELSEELGLPLIIHCVKCWDVLTGLRKELNPKQRWLVHGFRGKPSVLQMLTQAGIDVSFGEKFNAESLQNVAADHLFAETDASTLSIEEVISNLQTIRPDLTPQLLHANLLNFLHS